uniref:Uncharacterized protein n=1 Tax=Amphimedon queenslandica TaxID=400682 RepID=A0A1X7SJ36_AMPQE
SYIPDVQCIFGHLLESNVQYCTPNLFWKNFRLEDNQSMSKDTRYVIKQCPFTAPTFLNASEFFSSSTHQIDETLKKRGHSKVQEATRFYVTPALSSSV